MQAIYFEGLGFSCVCTQAGTDAAYRVMHGLSSQHHDALCRRQQLHPSILCLAGVALGLIGLLVLVAHVLPPLASLSPNDLDSCCLVGLLPLQVKSLANFGKIIQRFLWTKKGILAKIV